MKDAEEKKAMEETVKVKWYGYIVLLVALIFFSGIMKDVQGPLSAWDFNNLVGSFGKLGTLSEGAGKLANDFRGTGGSGAKDAFALALTLIPTIMLALGIIGVVEKLDGLKAAQKLLTPILRPILGIPGCAGLTLIASLQSTDAGAAMLKGLKDDGLITEKEKTVFAAFQYSAAATITNYLSNASVLYICLDDIGVALIIPLALQFVLKIFGANLMRLYLYKFCKEDE